MSCGIWKSELLTIYRADLLHFAQGGKSQSHRVAVIVAHCIGMPSEACSLG